MEVKEPIMPGFKGSQPCTKKRKKAILRSTADAPTNGIKHLKAKCGASKIRRLHMMLLLSMMVFRGFAYM
jgi:hypothetical protein